jgi:23S rRNA pseudouridine2605 synthase
MNTPRRIGLARRLSKLGICSRSEAERWVRAGRLQIDGVATLDPEQPTTDGSIISLDGAPLGAANRHYLMLNKPRGLTTSTRDERGRATVYECLRPEHSWPDADPALAASELPWLAPVGRLDRASEGLLLFSNDPEWAAGISDGEQLKTYHVRLEKLADEALLQRLREGVVDRGESLRVVQGSLLRANEEGRSRWLALTLNEGRNRHIRRLLAALETDLQRLLRVNIGPLQLGELPKGRWRRLTSAEVEMLRAGKE